jgi:hypothetical protein
MLRFSEVEKILKQLPVAYYLKRKLDVKLDYSDTSYIDIINDKLVVSYLQLTRLNTTTEEDVRCCLYHEVSHAFLTPLKMVNTDIINIFEDERIETICKHYYLDTDFKSFVFKTNNYHGEAPKDATQLFYQIVRYRLGPSQFVNRVTELINKYKSLNRNSDGFACADYADEVSQFYREVKDYWTSNQAKKEEKEDNKEEDDSHSSTVTETCNTDKDEEDNTGKQKIEESTKCNSNNVANDIDENTEKQVINDAIENINRQFESMNDENFQQEINQILFAKAKAAKMNGSAINAYSGMFDARSVVRQDYKYFVQKNRAGNVKRFSKVKLNLFIDDSGSFCSSEVIVNKMLYNLMMLERKTPDFEFDVVTMDVGEKLLKKDERKLDCRHCNCLDKDIFNLFDKVQKKDAMNINIVMFDGDAFSSLQDGHSFLYYKTLVKQYACNFGAFNKPDTIIISDYENKNHIEEYCKSAKKIFVHKDYAKLLVKNVVDNLKCCLK